MHDCLQAGRSLLSMGVVRACFVLPYIYIYMYMFVYVYVFVFVQVDKYMYVRICVYVYVYVYMSYMYEYISLYSDHVSADISDSF
jgi:hypothetical protein